MIKFEEQKKFMNLILEDVKFMIMSCKFETIIQQKFLESKYPLHQIYLKDLYAIMKKFKPNSKSLSNDIAQISDWLD